MTDDLTLKPIPSLPPGSYASTTGTIWAADPGGTLRPRTHWTNSSGYVVVRVPGKTGKKRMEYAHRLTLEAHVGPPPTPVALTRHLNHRRMDNRPGNLAWGDARSNTADRISSGKRFTGSTNGRAKLDPHQAYCVREMVKAGLAQAVVAAHFGISLSTVKAIARGRRWADELAALRNAAVPSAPAPPPLAC